MKYRKKPVEIEAIVWNGENIDEVRAFCGHNAHFHYTYTSFENQPQINLVLVTLEGEMQTKPGYYIVKGVEGEVYPCRADIFAKTYEAV